MSYPALALFIGILVMGSVVLLFGRTLNSADDEKSEEVNWSRELLHGPPGYYRAGMTLSGFVMMIVGIIGTLLELFHLIK